MSQPCIRGLTSPPVSYALPPPKGSWQPLKAPQGLTKGDGNPIIAPLSPSPSRSPGGGQYKSFAKSDQKVDRSGYPASDQEPRVAGCDRSLRARGRGGGRSSRGGSETEVRGRGQCLGSREGGWGAAGQEAALVTWSVFVSPAKRRRFRGRCLQWAVQRNRGSPQGPRAPLSLVLVPIRGRLSHSLAVSSSVRRT